MSTGTKLPNHPAIPAGSVRRILSAHPAGLAGPDAVFLDRDGVINRDLDYVHAPDRFEPIPGVAEAIAWLNRRGLGVIVVTNQAGIARGYYTEEQFERFTRWIEAWLAARGARIEATFFCPHHPTAGLGAYLRTCGCRKPLPGMIRAALDEFALDPARCLMIGDQPTDIAAAEAAGVRGHLFDGANLFDFVRNLVELRAAAG